MLPDNLKTSEVLDLNDYEMPIFSTDKETATEFQH
jgi:hypothetical protein